MGRTKVIDEEYIASLLRQSIPRKEINAMTGVSLGQISKIARRHGMQMTIRPFKPENLTFKELKIPEPVAFFYQGHHYWDDTEYWTGDYYVRQEGYILGRVGL